MPAGVNHRALYRGSPSAKQTALRHLEHSVNMPEYYVLLPIQNYTFQSASSLNEKSMSNNLLIFALEESFGPESLFRISKSASPRNWGKLFFPSALIVDHP